MAPYSLDSDWSRGWTDDPPEPIRISPGLFIWMVGDRHFFLRLLRQVGMSLGLLAVILVLERAVRKNKTDQTQVVQTHENQRLTTLFDHWI